MHKSTFNNKINSKRTRGFRGRTGVLSYLLDLARDLERGCDRDLERRGDVGGSFIVFM
jgi:hypothetical protein